MKAVTQPQVLVDGQGWTDCTVVVHPSQEDRIVDNQTIPAGWFQVEYESDQPDMVNALWISPKEPKV